MKLSVAQKAPLPAPEILKSRVKQWAGICVDGLPFVGAGGAITIALYALAGPIASLIPAIITAWIVWFFRDPERELPQNEKAIVSPADGKVIQVVPARYPRLLEGEATRVSIFMSVFNVHVNRIPFSGVVTKVHYNQGKYFAAYAEKASLENEQSAMVLETERGAPILFVQIAGLIARRIICRLAPGDQVSRGERFGLIRFGSRCDIYFPAGVEVTAKVGDKVKGGSTILGVFK